MSHNHDSFLLIKTFLWWIIDVSHRYDSFECSYKIGYSKIGFYKILRRRHIKFEIFDANQHSNWICYRMICISYIFQVWNSKYRECSINRTYCITLELHFWYASKLGKIFFIIIFTETVIKFLVIFWKF